MSIALQCKQCGAPLVKINTGFQCEHCDTHWVIRNGQLVKQKANAELCHYCGAPLPDRVSLNDYIICNYCGMKYWDGDKPKRLPAITSGSIQSSTTTSWHHSWASNLVYLIVALLVFAFLFPAAMSQIVSSGALGNTTTSTIAPAATIHPVVIGPGETLVARWSNGTALTTITSDKITTISAIPAVTSVQTISGWNNTVVGAFSIMVPIIALIAIAVKFLSGLGSDEDEYGDTQEDNKENGEST